MISEEHSVREKKLRGSGGYVFAKITEEEQKKGNLGGPELFLAGIGRLAEERLLKYFCNKCEKEYKGSPAINYENPNEDLGEGVTLVEKGEYKCTTCNNTISQYRKFDTSSATSQVTTELQSASAANTNAINVISEDEDQIQQPSESNKVKSSSSDASSPSIAQESTNTDTAVINAKKTVASETEEVEEEDKMFIPIQSLIDMPAYDSEAMLIGKVREVGLRRQSLASGKTQISIKITKYNSSRNDASNTSDDNTSAQTTEVLWNDIWKIGDIILLSRGVDLPTKNTTTFASTVNKSDKCSSCGYQNEKDAVFCEECGAKL
jgi:sporulation protein YlmC with PRC-barrel domain/DNA-directed RNA polymerase subunit RPC12/RpoP